MVGGAHARIVQGSAGERRLRAGRGRGRGAGGRPGGQARWRGRGRGHRDAGAGLESVRDAAHAVLGKVADLPRQADRITLELGLKLSAEAPSPPGRPASRPSSPAPGTSSASGRGRWSDGGPAGRRPGSGFRPPSAFGLSYPHPMATACC
ncbi:CU044_2847 family protein [Streptomyces sp. NPDC049577]|uniref:CU044_2847 family protein n=1 Tax=Streptomyces sp. NPDC049577 TaxID=3155153 RepID=UPI0034244516